MIYRHVLFAADFSEEALKVGARAKAIAERCGARLSALHVVEDMNISLGGGYELLPVLPEPVSYTHLDVYKRQAESGASGPGGRRDSPRPAPAWPRSGIGVERAAHLYHRRHGIFHFSGAGHAIFTVVTSADRVVDKVAS